MNLSASDDAERSAQQQDRKSGIAQAMASCRLEGLVPTPETVALYERYVAGELDIPEVIARLKALYGRE